MSSTIGFILGLGLGWWLAPGLTDIAKKVIEEIKDRRYR
jgi:hypothetical protein